MNLIDANLDKLVALCKKHKVAKLFVSGSSVTDLFDKERSDIDLLIEIDAADPVERGETLMSLWDQLEALLHRRIVLVTESSIKNPYRQKLIEATKVLIYDGTGERGIV